MPYDPDKHHRRSIRLEGYDYTQEGAYFVTICTHDRGHLFGDIHAEIMTPNDFGQVVADCWDAIPAHFPQVELDAFVVMPNHVHGIIVIVGATHASPVHVSPLRPNDGNPRGLKPHSIGAIVGSFKSAVSKRINILRGTPAAPVWHRNYYEHIIRNEDSLNFIRQYVFNNPATWDKDTLYTA